MNWFFIALLAPFLWAIVNHTDKYLLSKYFKGGGVGALMIFSTLSGLVVLPVALYRNPDLLSISFSNIGILIFSGFLVAIAVLFYLFALQDEETTIVVPFWQMVPIFGYFMGFLFLGETLTPTQITAGVLIVGGAFVLSFNVENGAKNRFKFKVVLLMTLSSFTFALYEVLFKFVAVSEDFWVSTFWEHVGLVIFGVVLFVGVKKYRGEFIKLLKTHSGKILSLNIGSEVVTFIGNIVTTYVALSVPLVLVLVVSSYQPVFVLAIGILLTLFFPKIAQENISPKSLIQKICAIAVILIGSQFLNG